jgi:hypothetical protein
MVGIPLRPIFKLACTRQTWIQQGLYRQHKIARMISNSPDHLCLAYFEEWELSQGESAPLELWLRRSREGLWLRGQPVEQTTPLLLRFPARA